MGLFDKYEAAEAKPHGLFKKYQEPQGERGFRGWMWNIARDVPQFAASLPTMAMPPPVQEIMGTIGKATEPLRRKVEELPVFAPLKRMEERVFAPGMFHRPEVTPPSTFERLKQVVEPAIRGQETIPQAALRTAESTPGVGVIPRTIRERETWYERPLPNIMDVAILLGGVGGLAKGKARAPRAREVMGKPVGKKPMEAKPTGIPKEAQHLDWRPGERRHSAYNLDDTFWNWYNRIGKKEAAKQGIAVRKGWHGDWYAYTTKQTVKPPPGRAELDMTKALKGKGVREKPTPPASVLEGLPRNEAEFLRTLKTVAPETSTRKVIQALKSAESVRKKQETLYTEERGVRLAKAIKAGEKLEGEAAYHAKLRQLEGELPKVEFEAIRKKVSQADIDNLFKEIEQSAALAEWEKITTGRGLAKIFGEFGGTVPTQGELSLLNRVFGEEFIRVVLSKRDTWVRMKDAGYEVANIPRSIMASFDLSAPLRQGVFLIGYPKQFAGAFGDMFKYFGSGKAYKALHENIVKKPSYELMRSSKLDLTEMGALLTKREEAFMSGLAEKIPLVGKVVEASGRAHTGFLNKLRADVFDYLVTKAKKEGLDLHKNRDVAKATANFINTATGRGSLSKFEASAKILNTFFFSPRLISSRLKLLWPGTYIKKPAFVRKQALRSLLAFSGMATTILGLAELMGADVETNPTSADFAKVRIGDTRLEVTGGFAQYMRAAAQLISGRYISSVTGREKVLGEGYMAPTRWDILARQVETKESPVASFVTTLLRGEDWTGEPISLPREVGERFVPMAISDMVILAKEDPALLPLGVPVVFGMGLQTYKSYPPRVREFYRFLSEAEHVDRVYKELPTENKRDFVIENRPLLRAVSDLRSIEGRMTELRKKVESIDEQDWPNEFKKAKKRELERQMRMLAEKGLRVK